MGVDLHFIRTMVFIGVQLQQNMNLRPGGGLKGR